MRVGVHVVRGAAGCGCVVLGAVVLVELGDDVGVDFFVEEEEEEEDVFVEVFDGDGLVEVGRGDGVSLVSWIERSSTGGGSEGDAATRNPSRTSRGTQSMAAMRTPSRPTRRRGLGFMGITLGRRDEPWVRAG